MMLERVNAAALRTIDQLMTDMVRQRRHRVRY